MTAPRTLFRLSLLLALAALLAGCGDTGEEYANSTLRALDRGKANGARGDMQVIAAGLTNYMTAEGELPAVSDIHSLADALEPNIIRAVKRQDPWGTDYEFSCDGSSYTMRSAGQDLEFGNGDDLIMEDGQITKMPDGFETKL